jgi:hypothetical protein
VANIDRQPAVPSVETQLARRRIPAKHSRGGNPLIASAAAAHQIAHRIKARRPGGSPETLPGSSPLRPLTGSHSPLRPLTSPRRLLLTYPPTSVGCGTGVRRATPGKVVWARQVLYAKRAKRLRTRIATRTETAQTRYLGRKGPRTLPHHLAMVAAAPTCLVDAARATSLSLPRRARGPRPRPPPSNSSNQGPAPIKCVKPGAPVALCWSIERIGCFRYLEHARPWLATQARPSFHGGRRAAPAHLATVAGLGSWRRL